MIGNMFYGIGGLSSHMLWGGSIFVEIGGLILLGLLIYWIAGMTQNRRKQQTVSNSYEQQDNLNAMNILNERYARGEIDEAGYFRIKAELRK